jgi:hypothetical protein
VQTATISLNVLPPGSGKVAVNMAAAYNVMGAVTDGARFLSSDGVDGGGRAYSGNLLGTTRTVGGSSFTFGAPNTPGAAANTTIALPPGNYSTLKLLATGVNGNQVSQRFIVSYSDGTSAPFTQSLSDWCAPQGYAGESTAVAMPYRNNSTGSRDTRPVNLYAYSFTLASGKTVKSITLPGNHNVVVFGITLETGSSASADGGSQNPIFDKTHIILYPAEHRAKR